MSEEKSCNNCKHLGTDCAEIVGMCSDYIKWVPKAEEEKSCNTCNFSCSEKETDICFQSGYKCWVAEKPRISSTDEPATVDAVDHPPHYTSHPSGVECIQITEHMNFNLGNALKYIWRADLKHDDGGIEDLKKAEFYIKRELKRRSKDV